MTDPKTRIIFYDFETTGLDPINDDIIEYCFRHNDTVINNIVFSIFMF